MSANPEKSPVVDLEEDEVITLKTKLAVLSLIFMYESYLFTLIMPAAVLTYIFGIGGGFQEMCFACAQELVPNRYRFQTLGVMILANHVSSFAPLIAYAFIAHTELGWRACYWWCFAWESLTAVLLFCFYHPPSFATKHRAAAESTGYGGSIEPLLTAAEANTPAAYGTIQGITNSTVAAVQHAVLVSNSKSYRTVYLVAIAFGCVAIAAALSVKSIDPSQRSNEVAAKLENNTHKIGHGLKDDV